MISDRGRGNKSKSHRGDRHGNGGRNSSPKKNENHEDDRRNRRFVQHEQRESSSPMVSSEARSPSPGLQQQQQQRRDSASSRNNRRSYSPQHRNVVSPSHPRPRGGYRDLRRGQGRRYDYHGDRQGDRGSSRDHDWRSDDYRSSANAGAKTSTQNKTIVPPRFQRSRNDREQNQAENHWSKSDSKVPDYENDDLDEDSENRVNDWSLEVEEEEERLQKKEQKEHRGGILRLPPDAMTTSTPTPNAADWRAPSGQVHNPNRSSDNYYNHYANDNNNPAWRGVDNSSRVIQQSSSSKICIYFTFIF